MFLWKCFVKFIFSNNIFAEYYWIPLSADLFCFIVQILSAAFCKYRGVQHCLCNNILDITVEFVMNSACELGLQRFSCNPIFMLYLFTASYMSKKKWKKKTNQRNGATLWEILTHFLHVLLRKMSYNCVISLIRRHDQKHWLLQHSQREKNIYVHT